jgi:16S rRNA (cytidine1402-2'-O)-methyltransferase
MAAAQDHAALGDDTVKSLAATEPRGEYVLVVAGAPAPEAPSADAVEDALRARMGAGADKRSAIAAVAAELGVPKRQVYEAALRL